VGRRGRHGRRLFLRLSRWLYSWTRRGHIKVPGGYGGARWPVAADGCSPAY
jgi:hypothetical protein